MKKTLAVLLLTAVLSVATIIALTYGLYVDWPDNIHLRYGVPLTWSVHTLSTIAGPVDIWQVDIQALLLNLLFWLGLMVAGVVILTHYKR